MNEYTYLLIQQLNLINYYQYLHDDNFHIKVLVYLPVLQIILFQILLLLLDYSMEMQIKVFLIIVLLSLMKVYLQVHPPVQQLLCPLEVIN